MENREPDMPLTGKDKTDYQREYMRKRRAARKDGGAARSPPKAAKGEAAPSPEPRPEAASPLAKTHPKLDAMLTELRGLYEAAIETKARGKAEWEKAEDLEREGIKLMTRIVAHGAMRELGLLFLLQDTIQALDASIPEWREWARAEAPLPDTGAKPAATKAAKQAKVTPKAE